MTEDNLQSELRFKNGSKILGYITRFSATEKVIFGAFVALIIITAVAMTVRVSDAFKVEIPARGGELREGIVGLPRTINPVLAITDIDRDLSTLVFSGLMKYENGKLVTDLAKSYTVSADGLTYNFILRNDVRFNDNTTLTADDIEYTIEKIQDANLKSPRRADWTNVSVNKISPTEIQFVLKQPYSPFLSNTTVGIIPKHIWGSVSDDQFIFSQYNLEPIGSGPYKISSTAHDSGGIPTQYKLIISDAYYAKKPFIETLTAHFYADEDKALAALDGGDIDSLATIPPAEATKITSTIAGGETVISSPLPRIFGVFLNQSQSSILADKNVRQALNMVIPRDTIIKNVLSGYGSAVYGPLPPGITGIVGTSTSLQATSTAGTISAAQSLLEKNGWKKGKDGIYGKKTAKSATTTLTFTLYTADSSDLVSTANILRDAWNKIGANVDVKTFSSNDLYQNVIRTRKFDALLFGEQIGKDRDLYAFWHSSQRNAPGLNVSMYANSKVDKILEEIRSTNIDADRADDYVQLDSLIQADMPAFFLYSPSFTYAIPKNLKGINLNSITVPSDRFNSISNWYLNTEKVWRVFTN